MKNNSPKETDPAPNKVVLERKLKVVNKLGLHARPAALFVQTANQFECDISVRKGKQIINGKSIMGLMMLAAGPGSNLVLSAEGHDAEKALDALERLLNNKFGEE